MPYRRYWLFSLAFGISVLSCGRESHAQAVASEATRAEASIKLIIADENTGAWTTFTNCIDRKLGERKECKNTRMGILAQFGSFPTALCVLEGVKAMRNEVEVPIDGLPSDQRKGYYWFNLVSTDAGAPIQDNLVVYSLLPLEKRKSSGCSDNDLDKPGPPARPCARSKSLHRDLDARVVMTMWPGNDGYRMTATPKYSEAYSTNRLEFTLPGGFTLEIWEITKNKNAENETHMPYDVRLLGRLNQGDFDSIIVGSNCRAHSETPHEHGEPLSAIPSKRVVHGARHDPPWPPDDGGESLTD